MLYFWVSDHIILVFNRGAGQVKSFLLLRTILVLYRNTMDSVSDINDPFCNLRISFHTLERENNSSIHTITITLFGPALHLLFTLCCSVRQSQGAKKKEKKGSLRLCLKAPQGHTEFTQMCF